MESTILVSDLCKSYDGKTNAVDKISFSVERGEIFGFLGRNGAGKSTTIKILTSLIKYDSGIVNVLGFDPNVNGMEIRRRIGVVQQGDAFDFTTVERNFDIYGILWNIPKEKSNRMKEELMDLFGLTEMRKKRMFDLSGGQKKRVQVAREFMHPMDILFLDEPTVGLDPIMRRSILDFIKKKAEEGLTVFFTTQNLEEADYICDRICIINKGKIMMEGTPQELKGKVKVKKIAKVRCYLDERSKSLFSEWFSPEDDEELKINESEIIIISSDIDKSVIKLLRVLDSNQIEVEGISMDSTTLDDVFLEAMRE
ncbi:ABC transporter ATP-binding protein [Caldiplasma sukawensis]